MKAMIKSGFSAFIGMAMFATTFVPAPVVAMPLVKADIVQTSDVLQVQNRRHHDSRNRNRHHSRNRHHNRHGWHNGHRGSRYHRRGYRRHSDGWWYPMAAFGAGAIIGGAIANNNNNNRPRDAGINPRHVQWCYARFRSYRSWDNTFQPNQGPRRQCLSPYF